MKVKISSGNSKMGRIASVSLPSVTSCRKGCLCSKKCYARKLERLRPSVREAYESNYRLLMEDPNTYWREVEGSIMMNRYFRFHVSGDIVDKYYFKHMVEAAMRNPHCQILCFTKQYEIVNEFIENEAEPDIPDNLHVIFSVYPGMKCPNPHNLPEAHIRFRDGSTTARNDAHKCGGNCTECAIVEEGCWVLQCGEQVEFNEH